MYVDPFLAFPPAPARTLLSSRPSTAGKGYAYDVSARDQHPEDAAWALAARLKRGSVAHAHIIPAFSKRLPLPWKDDLQSLPHPQGTTDRRIRRDAESDEDVNRDRVNQHNVQKSTVLPVDVQGDGSSHKPTTKAASSFNNIDSSARKATWFKDITSCSISTAHHPTPRIYPVRIVIHDKQDDSCRITLKAPTEDAFFHWSYNCNLFTFKTLARRHKWKHIPDSTMERETDAVINKFVELLKEIVRNCLNDPERYVASIEVTMQLSVAVLKFTEISRGYRRVPLLELEMIPSPWEEVVRDIREDHQRTLLHSSHLKTALIQCLEIVQRKQPGILATTGVPDPKRPGVSRPWRELVSDLMPTVAQEAAVMRAGGRMLSEEERLMRKKMFVLLTIPKDESLEAEYIKTVPVHVSGYKAPGDRHIMRLTFTFFAKGRNRDFPDAYIITINTNDDIFLNFASHDITPGTFRDMTGALELETLHHPSPGGYLLEDSNISSTSNHIFHQHRGGDLSDKPRRRHQVRRDPRGERDEVLGFRSNEGVAGGLVGVLGRDLLEGTLRDPERFTCELKIENKNPATSKGVLNQWDRLEGPTSQNPPGLRRARLVFCENVMFRKRELVRIKFVETAKDEMKSEIQERYAKLKEDIDWTQLRLDKLYDAVKKKNPSLLVELGTVPIPRSWTSSHTRWSSARRNKVKSSHPDEETPLETLAGITVPIQEAPVSEPTAQPSPGRIRSHPVLFSTRSVAHAPIHNVRRVTHQRRKHHQIPSSPQLSLQISHHGIATSTVRHPNQSRNTSGSLLSELESSIDPLQDTEPPPDFASISSLLLSSSSSFLDSLMSSNSFSSASSSVLPSALFPAKRVDAEGPALMTSAKQTKAKEAKATTRSSFQKADSLKRGGISERYVASSIRPWPTVPK